MIARAIAMCAALAAGAMLAHAEPREPLYESSLGPHGGAPWHRTRAQLEAMGGAWSGERFTTREQYPNSGDPHAATFVTRVTYTPLRKPKPDPAR